MWHISMLYIALILYIYNICCQLYGYNHIPVKVGKIVRKYCILSALKENERRRLTSSNQITLQKCFIEDEQSTS